METRYSSYSTNGSREPRRLSRVRVSIWKRLAAWFATSTPSYPRPTQFTSRSRSITDWCWRPSMNVSATLRAEKTSGPSCPNREMLMSKFKSISAFKTEAEEKEILGNARLHRLHRLEQGCARALSKPEALDHGDLNSSAAGLAGANQDRRQQARCAVSIADQGVAGAEGRVVVSNDLTASASCTSRDAG